MFDRSFRVYDHKEKRMIYDGMCDCVEGFFETTYTILKMNFTGELVGYINDDGGKNGLYEHSETLEKNRFTVMSFTGKVDKNKKRIFECDIIKCRAIDMNGVMHNVVGVVRWDNSDCGFYIDAFEGNWPCIKLWFTERIEIIGNELEKINENNS